MSQFVIIADDLTGANDTGVQFAKRGFRTFSLLDLSHQDDMKEADVLVYNADTRSMDSQAAYERIEAVSRELLTEFAPLVYKKIDSTLRGNIGAEIDAIMDHVPFDMAVVVPAYPASARLTVGGYHLVRHLLLEDSEMARDPKSPVTESYLPSLLGRQTKRNIGHVDIRKIRASLENLTSSFLRERESGNEIIVCDSCSQEDLKSIAEAVLKSGLNTLWVGSAGLAQCLAELMKEKHEGANWRAADLHKNHAPILVIAGSVSEVTKGQIETLQKRTDYAVVSANPAALLKERTSSQEKRRLVEEILKLIDEGKNPVLTTVSTSEIRKEVEEWARLNGKEPSYGGDFIADCLGELGGTILSKRKVSGLVVTGGDIASRTCFHLQVKALWIVDEVEEGIPLSLMIGGTADRLPIVTKAGAFGNPFSLLHSVQKIKGQSK